jgi:hypothetical protein
MGIIKHFTTYCPPPPPPPPPPGRPFNRDWEDHPSWITGIQALEEFHGWVARVVLPIAFQWIEENYKEVYAKVDKLKSDEDLKDDVGVVIAAAYELVKQRKAFEKGQEASKKFEEDQKHDRLDTQTLNPVWARITQEVRRATKEAFDAEKKYLDDTV